MRSLATLPLCFALCLALPATEPDAATRRWWSHVEALAGDALKGRDTGSEGYRAAARYVATEFERAGLKPAGESGYYQTVPLHAVRLLADESEVELVQGSAARKLEWFRQITIAANPNVPENFDRAMIFAGSDAFDAKDKVVVRLNRGRAAAPVPEGAAGVLTIDATGGPEPAHWPVAYAVSMTLAGSGAPPAAAGLPAFRFNPAAAELLFEGSGHTHRQLSEMAAAQTPLPSFPLPARLRAKLRFHAADLKSDNILAVLPGSDPALAGEYVVISAHLDGYGTGEPWHGDRVYNGAFDDAAYVATLIDLAQKWHSSATKLKRSVLFAVVTGEEKGLLGSRYFTQHPTVPKDRMVANINLDQLRPIFPLKILTALAVDESTLGQTVKRVAESMDIRIQPDPEPERNLLRRSDHYNFMQIGVPAVGFIFGYQKNSPEEAIYRRWYAERYHSPADDLQQPWDPPAAAKFNDFFARLVEAIANDPRRPRWSPGSTFGPTQ